MDCPGLIYRCYHYCFSSPSRSTLTWRTEYRLKKRLSCGEDCPRCSILHRVMHLKYFNADNVTFPEREINQEYYRCVLLDYKLDSLGRIIDYRVGFKYLEGFSGEEVGQ